MQPNILLIMPDQMRGDTFGLAGHPAIMTPNIDSHRVNLEGKQLHMTKAAYFGLINHIDDQLTWLIKEFDNLSRSQNRSWIIIFTSDHWEMLGDHYYFCFS
jgi:arylsulfatase A-like enzyme